MRVNYLSDTRNPFRQQAEDAIVHSPEAAKFARAGRKQDFVHHFRVNRTPRGIGLYTSLAMQVSFPYWSAFELALMQFLDILDGVLFWPQPLRFNIVLDGRSGLYTPDCGVLVRQRRLMFEFKFRKTAESAKHAPKWPAVASEIEACGYRWKHLDEKRLGDPTFADRLQALQRYRRVRLDPYIAFDLEARFSMRPSWRMDEALAEIEALGQHEDTLFALVIRRKLYVDLWGPLDEATRFFPAQTAPIPALLED